MGNRSRTRYTMLLDESALKHVERLQKTFGLKNKAEVYDLAVRVLSWVTEQQLENYEVGRYKPEVFQPLLLPYTPDKQKWFEGKDPAA